MGKQPAVLIIARHGTRLDQGKKEWRETADRPWDSPLSYGGFIQSQSLGARIATELQYLDSSSGADESSRDSSATSPRPKKKRKIVIHSSPYLRCIQTSIGIAAGLRYPQESAKGRPQIQPYQRSSLSNLALSAEDVSSLPNQNTLGANGVSSRVDKDLTNLKLDAWLGEWLSSGYYDEGKHPPPSEELIKIGKEWLKKPTEEIRGADIATVIQEFDGVDWADKARETKALAPHEKTGLRAMAALGHSMPRRSRTISFGKDVNGPVSSQESTSRRPRSTTYSPPIPTYSIAPHDQIPIGFVAHARDACVEPDFEWDSQQPPLNWGNGGEYEEEWSTMHRRFRDGIINMLTYYEGEDEEMEGTDSDESEELVLILVTHQAGSNALIRLVTGAPALHDVAPASLTLAVRKPGLSRKESRNNSQSPPRRGSLDLGINDEFEMKIIASTEHLRHGSNPLGLNSPRLGMSPALSGRKLAGADSAEGFSIGDPLAWRSASQTNLGRAGSMRSHAVHDHSSDSGLWSMEPSRNSMSSEGGYQAQSQPKSPPLHPARNSNNVIVEDEAIENWAASGAHHAHDTAVLSPVSIDTQSIWQPIPTSSSRPIFRAPSRSDSTRITNSPAATTGLWGSPVINAGGVKEGTPHSRGSFGMTDAATPFLSARAGNKGSMYRNKSPARREFDATIEEDEP